MGITMVLRAHTLNMHSYSNAHSNPGGRIGWTALRKLHFSARSTLKPGAFCILEYETRTVNETKSSTKNEASSSIAAKPSDPAPVLELFFSIPIVIPLLISDVVSLDSLPYGVLLLHRLR